MNVEKINCEEMKVNAPSKCMFSENFDETLNDNSCKKFVQKLSIAQKETFEQKKL